jgi:hypothetical protein
MRGNLSRSVLLVAALGFLAGCEELVPPEPEPKPVVVAKPVKKPVVAAPVVKKKPVIVFDEGGDGGGGWD